MKTKVRHIKYIDEKLTEYTQSLSEADGDKAQEIKNKISKHKEQRANYKSLETQLNVSEFVYNYQDDTYCCPAGEILKSNGNWYQKNSYRVKQYKTNKCKACQLKNQCTRSKSKRLIERHEFAAALQKNKKALLNNPEIHKQRQAIVEHPFGTMKRQWRFDHIMTKKTKERASSDVGLIFIAYNLRRLISIIGISNLAEYLKEALQLLFTFLSALRLNISHFKQSCFLKITEDWFCKQSLKGLYLVKNL